MKGERGFTLLELLMVVIIIAILVSLALPQYFRTTERARTSQVLQLLGGIRSSELRFRAQDPSNLYDNSAGLVNLDIGLPAAMPIGWAAPTVSGTAAGSNVSSARVGGTHNAALLQIDLDSGTVCGSTAASAADWGVGAPGC